MSESKPDRDASSSHPPSLSTTKPEMKPTDATKVSPPRGFVHAIRGFMRPPPWVINNIHQRKSQKLLFRSCLASWATLILLLSNQSLRTIGNLGFFGMLFSMFVPPGYPVQIYIVLVSQALLGLLTGWGIGSAAMKAATSVRSQLVDEATLQNAVNSFQGSVNPEQLYKVEVFQGVFLDASASVIFGVFFGFGTLVFALVRAYSPPFLFFSIFGTIAVDFFCAIGPLYPFSNYTIINSLLLSASSYAAIALLCCFILFPETVNHVYLGIVSTILDKVKTMLSVQDHMLSPQPGDFGPKCPKLKSLLQIRVAVAGMFQTMLTLTVHLKSEFSVGRWNGDDASRLADPLLAVISRINGLLSFSKHVCDQPPPPEALSNIPTPASVSTDTHLLHHVFSPDVTRESALNLRLSEILPNVRDATAELRAATIGGVVAAKDLITAVNSDRLFSRSVPIRPLEENLDSASDKLRTALNNFKERGADSVLGAYGQKPRADKPLRGLYLGYVFCSTAMIIGEVVLSLVQTVAEISARRQRVRLWGPSSLRNVAKALLKGRRRSEEQAFGEEQRNETYLDEEDIEYEGRHADLDPDSHPPTNLFQKFMNLLHLFLRWTKTAEALFVFRYVLLSILLWLPAVFRNSAHFYYVNKGIWAVIIAQTILTVYAGDQIFNFMIRIGGTLLGLIAAILIWYIGNGGGNGNPYGLAASYAVLIVPVMFVRLFTPPQFLPGAILGTATVALVIGYSWIDGHLPVISNPGIGGNAAWRRCTLVLIGCTATFIIMMCPPKSGRKAVRLRAATSIDELGHVYTMLMSAWIMRVESRKDVPFTSWVKPFRRRLIVVTAQLHAGKQQMMLATWEGSVRGRWPKEEYIKLTEVQEEMIAVLAQLGGALWKLDAKWRQSLLHNTNVVDPNFISDVVSVFTSVSQSLYTGTPLHSVLPETLLDRLLLHHRHAFTATPDIDDHSDIGPDELQSLEHMFYTSAVVAVYQLIRCLDELLVITRRLCGEVPIRGFEKWILEHKSRRGAGTVIPITASRTNTVAEQDIFIVGEKSEEEVV
ncbi:hypothetical protein F5888DRAFT_760893 [Russula emetica]|nr:hypothetical protein F5888DRAFT_760893 [Russula emetica]